MSGFLKPVAGCEGRPAGHYINRNRSFKASETTRLSSYYDLFPSQPSSSIVTSYSAGQCFFAPDLFIAPFSFDDIDSPDQTRLPRMTCSSTGLVGQLGHCRRPQPDYVPLRGSWGSSD
jgi:hypothetical protein